MTLTRIIQILIVGGPLVVAANLYAQCPPAIQHLVATRRFDEARGQLEVQLKRASADAAATHCMGRLYLEANNSSDAVRWLEKAVTLNEQGATHHLWLGIALRAEAAKSGMLRGPGLAARMKKELEQALRLDPKLVDARYALLQYYAGAPAWMGGDMGKARDEAAELQKLSPMRGHMGYGVVSEQENDFVAAEKEFLASIAIRPDSDVVYSAAAAFYRRRERWSDAAGMTEKQLKAMPEDATSTKVSNAHYFLGVAHGKSGHPDKARAAYMTALTANPSNDEAKKALDALVKDQ
jgi:tetratricopeptide (TPR) repeat protein